MNKKLSEDELINRINELAHKQKKDGLTDDEKSEQKKTATNRYTYSRESFKSQIEMMQIYDKNGKEVTPEKVKEIQRKKGLRDD